MRSDRQKRIEQRAHDIWVAEGRPHGKHDEHWHRAEREIAREGTKGSSTGSRAKSTTARKAGGSKARAKTAAGAKKTGAASRAAKPARAASGARRSKQPSGTSSST